MTNPQHDLQATDDDLLGLLAETATTAERVAGLRLLGLRIDDIATACGVGAETVRVWETGRPPQAKHHRVLDRLRYISFMMLRTEGSAERVHSWLTSCNPELDGQLPFEIFAERSRDVMRAAAALSMERQAAARGPRTAVRVDIVDEPRPDGAAKPPSLTANERALHRLVTEGLNTRQIAERLGITEPTARKRLSQLKQKLGVSTMRQAQQVHVA